MDVKAIFSCPTKRLTLSGRLLLMGTALLVILASCSQNGGSMGDKNGKGDTVLRQNGPGADKEWTRIIVRLNVPDIDRMQSKSAALKDPAAARAMDQQIAKQIALVADRVISKVEPAGAKLIRRYDTLPLLAMAVTPKAVSVLKSLPEVIGIEADSLNRPMR